MSTKTLTISALDEKEVKTQDGPKKKWVVQFEEKPGVWLEAWKGQWNSGWKLNAKIDIDTETQIRKKEYKTKDGKVGFNMNIMAPEGARRGGSVDLQPLLNSIQDLQLQVADLEHRVSKIELGDKEEIPVFEKKEGVDVNEIPF